MYYIDDITNQKVALKLLIKVKIFPLMNILFKKNEKNISKLFQNLI